MTAEIGWFSVIAETIAMPFGMLLADVLKGPARRRTHHERLSTTDMSWLRGWPPTESDPRQRSVRLAT